MIQLIGVRLVQFFLYEKRDVRVGRTCGIFGANGSGKSSLLDAVQIVMLGGSARRGSGVVFNAQADESNSNTRSIRSYCLGQYGDAEGARVRDDAISYITLVWMDTSTREIVSTGICISASSRREEHDILGRYIFSSDLTLNDHLEIVDGEERPREWGAFREQLRQRSRPNDEILFHDADRFVKALLLRLRGSGGVAQIDAFRQAFRFGLRMRFDQSIDQIVRHQVLEARPTNVQRFKEVFSTFKELSAKVAEVRAKITHAEKIDKEYEDAERRQGHTVTWQALGKACEHEVANQAVEAAEAAEGQAVVALEAAQALERSAQAANELAATTSAAAASRRDTHASHGSKKFLEEQLAGARGREEAPRRELRATLSALAALLETAARSDLVPKSGNEAMEAAQDIRSAIAGVHLAERAAVDRVARRALRAATSVVNGLFSVRAGIANDLARARELLGELEGNRVRMGTGKPALDSNVAKLARLLDEAGVKAIPVCDLVRIDDVSWQPAVEAYLGDSNLQALLVDAGHEKAAFGVYRRSGVFGAKVIMPSRYESRRSPPNGAVAELVLGTSVAAVNFLRSKLGETMRAETEGEVFSHRSALTRDGMLLAAGDLTRLKPVDPLLFKLGTVQASAVGEIDKRIKSAKSDVQALEQRGERVKTLFDQLSRFAGNDEEGVSTVLQTFDRAKAAADDVSGLQKQIEALDTAEYRKLVDDALVAADRARAAQEALSKASGDRGKAESEKAHRAELTAAAKGRQQETATRGDRARSEQWFDTEFYAEQWDKLLARGTAFGAMVDDCEQRAERARRDVLTMVNNGQSLLGEYLMKFQDEFLPADRRAEWRTTASWVRDRIAFLEGTRLQEYESQMKNALEAARSTFRNDVAVALNERLEWLKNTVERMNGALRAAPAFTNGERYQFKAVPRPAHAALLNFVKKVADFGPQEDLLGGPGEVPPEFEQLMHDKAGTESRAERSPLDDYREFFDFDVEVIRDDATTGARRVIGALSKRVGSGSGGEHRAPLYVVAGAAMASAYRLRPGDDSGVRLLVIDEAFVKMDPRNITSTMRYFEELGLQVFMAGTGDALGTLTAFLDRYYDIMRDADSNVVLLEGHSIDEATREMFRADLPEFHPELVEQEIARMYSAAKSDAESVAGE